MKLRLITLTLDNFKCYDHKEFRFEGRSGALRGRNGTGKTTVYDAFTWLLFGKDSKGDKDFLLKPVQRRGAQAGEVADHAAVTAVEAELEVEGARRHLRRTYYEVWSTKRGQSEAGFEGHSSDYYVDGVPVKKQEYDRRVGALVPEEKFRQLTDLFYFTKRMSWRERRGVLFEVAGVATEGEIMASDPRFAPLAEAMGPLSLEDTLRKLAARRKALNKSREDTPARLDECRKTVEELGGIDFPALSEEREAKAGVRRELYQRMEASLRDREAAQLEAALLEARGALQTLEARNAAWRSSQAGDRGAEEAALRRNLAGLGAEEKRRARDLAYLGERAEDLLAETEQSRAQAAQLEGKEFQGTRCPTCGQRLPEDKLAEAKAGFEREKAAGKARWEAAARRAEERRQETLAEASRLEAEAEAGVQRRTRLEARLGELAHTPEAEVQDLPEYPGEREALEERIADLERRREQRAGAAGLERRALQRELDRVEAELSELSGELSKGAALERARVRMAELRAQAAAAAKELAEVDKLLSLGEAFARYKAQFIEESVNRRFSLVKFRLFREQVNGGIEDCCDVLVDGAAVGNSLNTGAEFRAGVDIINTLSRSYGIYVPLFIDGAESVTDPLQADTQTIRLVVDGNEELRVEVL